MLDQINERVRKNVIDAAILTQEEKYIDNVNKFNRQLAETKDARKRVYSRLLKVYSDDFVLKQRTYAQDLEIIKTQIDTCLPLIDPSKEQTKSGKK